MNTTEADKPLMIAVERIVRPIRAMESRKDRMREELLGHLQQLVEREGGLDRALQEFGEPDELREQLQATVPAIERVLFTGPHGNTSKWTLWQRRDQESDARFALRVLGHNCIVISASMVVPLLFWLLFPAARTRSFHPELGLTFVLAMSILIQLCSVAQVMIGSPMARALAADEYARVVLLSGLTAVIHAMLLLATLGGFFWWFGGTAAIPIVGKAIPVVLVASLWMVGAGAILVHLTQREAERRCWTDLQISE